MSGGAGTPEEREGSDNGMVAFADEHTALRDALRELAEASRGYVGCEEPPSRVDEADWSPCGACWGCRLSAAVQRADALVSAPVAPHPDNPETGEGNGQ